jgi:hypothetical protein
MYRLDMPAMTHLLVHRVDGGLLQWEGNLDEAFVVVVHVGLLDHRQ